MEKSFKTTDRTNYFIVALEKIEEAESAVLNAMCETYGDEDGERMTSELGFDKINDEVLRCMRVVILENLRDNPETI